MSPAVSPRVSFHAVDAFLRRVQQIPSAAVEQVLQEMADQAMPRRRTLAAERIVYPYRGRDLMLCFRGTTLTTVWVIGEHDA